MVRLPGSGAREEVAKDLLACQNMGFFNSHDAVPAGSVGKCWGGT